ncbi:MAG: MMPL family transporter [Actinobacteria bacterium]|nr:MMPL family transporter [Actinomycetota bacterium]
MLEQLGVHRASLERARGCVARLPSSERVGDPTSPPAPDGLVARLARWVVHHRALAIGGWLALLVAVLVLAGAAGSRYAETFSLPNTDSQRAYDLLRQSFPGQSGDSDQIVLHATRGGGIAGQAARIDAMLARVARIPHVSHVSRPIVSRDGTIAFATVSFDQRANVLPRADAQRLIDTAQAIRSPALQVELGGQAIEQAQQQSFGTASAIGLLAAIVVLLLTFGSLTAMGMPILTAVLGLGTAFGLIALLSHVLDVPSVSTELAAMVGLGVGIDYALFIVTRYREAYRHGMSVDDAVVTAMDTAGRAVLFAGLTVIIAVLGMCLLGVDFLYGMSIATALGVLMTMLAALTLLPALMARFGDKLGRFGRRARKRMEGGRPHDAFWTAWAQWIGRHPWPAMLAGLAIVVVLAVPALSLRLGQSDAGNDVKSHTTRQAYDLLAKGFGPGFNGPLLVVAQLPHDRAGAAGGTLAQVRAALARADGIASVGPPVTSPDGRVATVEAFPRSAPQDAATTELVHRLRDRTLPPVERASGAQLLVAGSTAVGIDFSSVLASKLPLFIGVVVGLAALLLLVVFRSLVIPLQAAVMNLLSIGASLGVAVAVFQYGWLSGLVGVQAGPIDAFIPVMLFAIVFGLSMDYEVFLISRVHEEWVRRRDAHGAVVDGLAKTGRVITAAATIMICVFLAFAINDDRAVKLFGASFAVAVFIDAFIVRSLLLPAVLHLLGRRTWWLPASLDRHMPHLAIEPPLPVLEAAEPAADDERALTR